MATKRDIDLVVNTDGQDCEPQQPTKRARNSGGQKKSRQSHEPQTDVTYGQRCCFPGLDHDHDRASSDEDVDFEDETDALAYLQQVR